MNRFLVILVLLALLPVSAQQSAKYTNEYVVFQRAQELFDKGQYAAARNEYRVYIDKCSNTNDPTYTKALYYEAMSALELHQNDAVSLVETFIRNYPESIYKTSVSLKLGFYYYTKKDHKTCIKWLTKIEKIDLPKESKDEYYFKLGYSYFQLPKYTEARNAFYEVKNSRTVYGPPALYYYSHIAYEDKSYQTALEGFLKLKSDSKYGTFVPYYICQIYYYQGKYQEVTEFASTLTDSVSRANQRQVNQIIGDSYFKIGKYDQATYYLEQYSVNQKTSRSENYQLGYTYYKTGAYDKAVKFLDKAAQIKDDLGQMALYHIGECYLKKGDEVSARRAFEVTAGIEISPKIQEDALYNYAILSYKLDMNPYNEALKALTLFINKYPESSRKNEVYQYLINVYTQTSNYDEALKSLDKIAKLDIKLGTAYQIIAFNRGVELFLKGNYYKATESFDLVDKHPVDLTISAKAKYWISESYMKTNNYAKAIQGYKNFLGFHNVFLKDLRANAYYNLGYAYLAKLDYTNEIDAFKMYLQEGAKTASKEQLLDATMRLADAYYVTKANELAIRAYEDAIKFNLGFQDQALYYIAKLCYYKQDYANRIVNLEKLITTFPDSKYVMTALFELGSTYRVQQNDEQASIYFQTVIKEYPESILVKDALIEMADIYLKRQEYTLSEEYYKKVLETFSSDRNSCADAVKGLINLYKTLLQPERVDEVVAQYDCAEFSKDEQEEIYYNTAIDPYLDSNFREAKITIHKYLAKFPTGKYTIEMKSYLANSFYQTKEEDSAIVIYRELLAGPTTDFSELAAVRTSRYFYNSKKYEEALGYYTKLENITSKPDILKNTIIGLMRCHFLLENWSNAAGYATKVLSSSQLKPAIQLEAQFALGIASYHITKFEDARKALTWVINNTDTEFAAEARFVISDIAFEEKEYAKTEEGVQSILKMKPAYDYWIAKAFLLQAKVHEVNNDLFQAEQAYQTVITNYPNQEDGIIAQAEEELKRIQEEKAVPEEVIPMEEPLEIEIDETQKVQMEELEELILDPSTEDSEQE